MLRSGNFPRIKKLILEISIDNPFHFNLFKEFLFFKIKVQFLKIFIYLFIYHLFWLCRVLVAVCRIFVVAHGIFSCSMHVGSSSPTRDRTQAPCIGSAGSYPLDHQGSPSRIFYLKIYLNPTTTCHSTITETTDFLEYLKLYYIPKLTIWRHEKVKYNS